MRLRLRLRVGLRLRDGAGGPELERMASAPSLVTPRKLLVENSSTWAFVLASRYRQIGKPSAFCCELGSTSGA